MNWFQKAKTFLAEVRGEMKKVTFPSRQEVISTTVVVLVASFIFAIYLWIADQVIVWGYSGILEWFGS
jgi:preprotein translocase subunit SecE